MKYDFQQIELKWQKYWEENQCFKISNDSDKKKFYVLDMFPYPSGAGLHVGHPLGYIASDIYARYKNLNGYNVLHPMGFDSFGLPAEQYAIQTGQHPSKTTEENIQTYLKQLKRIGFSFDWSREVRTSDPSYYKWTQWIFIQLFDSWYNTNTDKAESIEGLMAHFEQNGNVGIEASTSFEKSFSAPEWNQFSEKEKSDVLLEYRLTYLANTYVNWCPELGTVLANDEVKDGLSERGGFRVVQKKMRQWMMRITAYADRLEAGLNNLEWSESIKDIQRNWIGKSKGASIQFSVSGSDDRIEVFTTRPDTLFGASFMVLAPEHQLVNEITTDSEKDNVLAYIEKAAKKTERERMAEVKTVSGVFTGAYVDHPFNDEKLPIWVADYVLAGYGTGAIMAVPSGDQRDWNFAKKFDLPIPPVIEGSDIEEGANDNKEGVLMNSDFLNGLKVEDAIETMISRLEQKGIGQGKINYKIRDAVFSRQRYWGEPVPIYFENDIPKAFAEADLPLELPEVDQYLPTAEGEPPLARAKDWKTKEGHPIETNTMPGWAGSSWYMFRYMDPDNTGKPFSKEAVDYWENVDFYVGGAEHATGHLLYARFWTKFLNDIGVLPFDEPFKKMMNQGMITYFSLTITSSKQNKIIWDAKEIDDFRMIKSNLISDIKKRKSIEKKYEFFKNKGFTIGDFRESRIPISLNKEKIDLSKSSYTKVSINDIKSNILEYQDFEFFSSLGRLSTSENISTSLVLDKMSKSKLNVVNPDELIDDYGADTLRCYEMFLGPVEQHKPWDTKGIEGAHRFLRRFWGLFFNEDQFEVSEEAPGNDALKALHKFLKKVKDDIERLSFNTVVSECMILTNQLIELKCNNRSILEPFVIAISPYAPHIAEELWEQLGHNASVVYAGFPKHDDQYLVEDSVKYPVSFNGKVRFVLELPADMSKEEVEQTALADSRAEKWLEGKQVRKVIVVPKKIVNIVIG